MIKYLIVKEKKVTKDWLISEYMEAVVLAKKPLKNLDEFCNKLNIDKEDFQQHFEDINALESEIFVIFFSETLDLLYNAEDYSSFETKDKVLSFYYTFFELLSANKEYVEICLSHKNIFSKIVLFKDLRECYTSYIEALQIEFIDVPLEEFTKLKDFAFSNISWAKLLFTINYWLKDDSEAKAKTDVFIEKSVHTAFDIIDIKTIKNVLDLGKFLIQDMNKNKK